MRVCNGGDGRKILDGADFVVRRHNGDQSGVVGNGVFELLQIDVALLVHVEVGDRKALVLQRFAGVEHRVMFDARGDDVLAALCRSALHKAADCKVIGLRAAAGEHDFEWVGGVQRLCDLGACVLHGATRLVTDAVKRGWVAVKLGEPRLHSVIYGFGHGRGRRIVRIDKSAHRQMFASLWRFFVYNIHRNGMKYQAK